jgi:hypothetical protein
MTDEKMTTGRTTSAINLLFFIHAFLSQSYLENLEKFWNQPGARFKIFPELVGIFEKKLRR